MGSKNRGFINSVADDYGKHTMFLNKEYLLDGRSSVVLVICDLCCVVRLATVYV